MGHLPSVSEYVNRNVSDKVEIVSSQVAGAWAGLLTILLLPDLPDLPSSESSSPSLAHTIRLPSRYRTTTAPVAVTIAPAAISNRNENRETSESNFTPLADSRNYITLAETKRRRRLFNRNRSWCMNRISDLGAFIRCAEKKEKARIVMIHQLFLLFFFRRSKLLKRLWTRQHPSQVI